MSYYHPIPDKNPLVDRFLKTAVDLVAVILFVYFLCTQFFHVVHMDGASMDPCIKDQDVVFANRFIYKMTEPERYDMIACEVNKQIYIKRIVGIPGDHLSLKDGYLYINGEKSSLCEGANAMIYEGILAGEGVTLKEDEYFILGDNWNVSEDSRSTSIGKVWKDQLIGKVWFRISPIQSIGFISN